MLRERRVDTRDEFRHALDAALYAGLRADIVVLDPIEQTRETPERVGFYGGDDGRGEDRGIDILGIGIWRVGLACQGDASTASGGGSNLPTYADRNTSKKGVARSLMPCTYPLAGCRIAQTYNIRSRDCVVGPSERCGSRQVCRPYPLRRGVHPEWNARSCPWDIYLDLVPYLLVQTVFTFGKREIDQRLVFPALAF